MIEIRAMGPVDVSVGGLLAPAELLWRKNLALLIYLARSPRRARTREHLVGLLWGGRPESSARHSLREAIRAIRQVGGDDVLVMEGDRVLLPGAALSLDLDDLEAHAAAQRWSEAAGCALGEFLEGFAVPDAPDFEDWLTAERASARATAVNALLHVAEGLQRSGQLEASADAAHRALSFEPASARAIQAAMTAHALRGERGEALAAFEMFAKKLRDQLGAEPDAATMKLAGQVRRERAWKDRRAVSRGAETRRAPLTGRDADLARMIESWEGARAGKARIVLVEAPSGAGRTRLVEEIVARARLDGAAISEVRGAPSDRATPWSGVHGLARGGLLSASGLAGAPAPALATFAQRIDEWGDAFPSTRQGDARETGDAFTDVLRAVSAEQPVVVSIDDAHWLDAETLAVLQSVARDLAQRPVFIIITATTHQVRDEIELLRSRLGRDVPGTRLQLAPLGSDALRRLASWAMPAWSDAEVDRLARRIAADSAGLPLLALELLHAVALGLDLHGTARVWPEPQRTLDQSLPGELPDAVVAAIRIGFRRLGKHAQMVVAAAAVQRDRAEPARLARITDLAPADLAVALDEAEWERWIAMDGRGYSFVARIAREVVARDFITEGQRRRYLDA